MPDPANPQSFNRYSYALNNPVNLNDPSGHCAENGDDECWSYFERTISLCPQCQYGAAPLNFYLDSQDLDYQKMIFGLVQNGWRPTIFHEKVKADYDFETIDVALTKEEAAQLANLLQQEVDSVAFLETTITVIEALELSGFGLEDVLHAISPALGGLPSVPELAVGSSRDIQNVINVLENKIENIDETVRGTPNDRIIVSAGYNRSAISAWGISINNQVATERPISVVFTPNMAITTVNLHVQDIIAER